MTTRRTSAETTSGAAELTPSSCPSGSDPADYVRRAGSDSGWSHAMNVTPARASWRVVLVALVAMAVVGAAVAAYAAKQTEPTRRIVYGTTKPQNAPGQSMNLQQVEIDPGAKLPEHFH